MRVRTRNVAWLRGGVPAGLLVSLILHVSCGGNTEPPRAAAIRIEPSSALSLLTGESYQLTATPLDAGGSALAGLEIDWSTGDSGVATVDGSGLVTGLMPGSARIVASADTASGETAVTVLAQVTELTISPSSPSLLPGTTLQLIVSAEDAGGDRATWGRHKSRTRPVPGNREYLTPNARGYFNYFGAAAGDPATGYYSYELGAWHILALNTQFTGREGSPQAQWVKADLAAHPKKWTLAIYHVPLFGPDSLSPRMEHVFDLLHKAGAELVINGHEHNYQRFAPQTTKGVYDPERGVREFIVGTGGKGVGVADRSCPTGKWLTEEASGCSS